MAAELGKAEVRGIRSPVVVDGAITIREEANESEGSEVVGLRSKTGLLRGDASLGAGSDVQVDTRECENIELAYKCLH